MSPGLPLGPGLRCGSVGFCSNPCGEIGHEQRQQPIQTLSRIKLTLRLSPLIQPWNSKGAAALSDRMSARDRPACAFPLAAEWISGSMLEPACTSREKQMTMPSATRYIGFGSYKNSLVQ